MQLTHVEAIRTVYKHRSLSRRPRFCFGRRTGLSDVSPVRLTHPSARCGHIGECPADRRTHAPGSNRLHLRCSYAIYQARAQEILKRRDPLDRYFKTLAVARFLALSVPDLVHRQSILSRQRLPLAPKLRITRDIAEAHSSTRRVWGLDGRLPPLIARIGVT